MSRMLKPVLAGLAISSLCLALTADLIAQTGTKNIPTGTKNKQPIKPVQAEEDEPAPAPLKSRTRPVADADDSGEPARPPGQGKKATRPESMEPLRIEKVSPELEKVLKDWEFHTSQFKIMAGEFSRYRYDKTFEVEKRADGKFVYEAPDKGNYELWGAKIGKDEISKKLGKNRTPYELKPDDPERWVCTGKEVIRIDDKPRPPTFEKVPIPEDGQGQNIMEGPLPFLFGMKAERAKRRYKGLKLQKNQDGEIWLEVHSKLEQDRAWETAVVIIDSEKFVPKAVKLKDVTGAESVHVFKNIVVNARRGFFDKDPFRPSLRGYQQVLPPAASKAAKSASGKGGAGALDNADLNLGRTADSAADLPARKKGTPVNRK